MIALFNRFQSVIQEGIEKHLVVILKYKEDIQYREYEPYYVYHSSTKGKDVMSFGIQRINLAKPQDKEEFHRFELSLIKDAQVTKEIFTIPENISLNPPSDCKSLICGIKR